MTRATPAPEASGSASALGGIFSPPLLALVKPQLAPALSRLLCAGSAEASARELLPHLEALVAPAQQADAGDLLIHLGAMLARRAEARARAAARGT